MYSNISIISICLLKNYVAFLGFDRADLGCTAEFGVQHSLLSPTIRIGWL
jgi:hypothetical protein